MRSPLVLAVDNSSPPDPPRKRRVRGWQGNDKALIHRRQMIIGAEFVDSGRLKHGERWVLVELRQFITSPAGNVRVKRHHEGNAWDLGLRLVDEIVLRRVGGNQTRRMSLSQFSYAAVWQVP